MLAPNKKLVFFTVASPNYFQSYVGPYKHFLSCSYPDCKIIAETQPDVPDLPSAFNLYRFLRPPKVDFDYMLITDVDLLLFNTQNVWDWHFDKMVDMGSCYYAHHGPYKYPQRFPGGWKGDRERLAGGFVMITPEWLERTREARDRYLTLLLNRQVGLYREEDEVILCRICKESGLPISYNKSFPSMLRGIHLGDFKKSMSHRWTNKGKMASKMTDENCRAYMKMELVDEKWQEIKAEACKDAILQGIFDNLGTYLKGRFK